MKKIISILLVAMLTLSSAIAVNAEGIKDVFDGGVKSLEARGEAYGAIDWEISADGLLTISSTDGIINSGPWLAHRPEIFSIEIGEGVTEINGGSFSECSNLTAVYIPASVQSIATGAFYNCSNDLIIYGAAGSCAEQFVNDSLNIYQGSIASGTTYQEWIKEATNHTVTFDANGGIFADNSTTKSVEKEYGVDMSLADIRPTRYGCAFLGWSVKKYESVKYTDTYNTDSSKDVTLYALWNDPSIVERGQCGAQAYYFRTSSGALTIYGSGAIGKSFSNDSNITSVIIESGITSMCDSLFYGCTNLKSVEIPSSVTSIGNSVCYNCSSSLVVTGESGSEAQRYCEQNNIKFREPNGPIASGTDANNINWSLSVDGVLTISGSGAMQDYASGKAPWNDYKSSIKSVVIENGVTRIGNNSFSNCNNVTSVDVADSVTSIGSYAFRYCSSLNSVVLPDRLTSIGRYAFDNCTSLTSFDIPDGVTSIEEHAFFACLSLVSVNVPDSVTDIGLYAFQACTNLTSINIPDNVKRIRLSAFAYCYNLTSITIPDGVTEIGDNAFAQTGLCSIIIPESVETVGASAFCGCKKLEYICFEGASTSVYKDYNITIPRDAVVIAKPNSPAAQYCGASASGDRYARLNDDGTYDIQLYTNGGTLPEGVATTVTKTIGEPVTLPIPTKSDEEFLGWSQDYNSDGSIAFETFNGESVSLNAVWLNSFSFIDLSSSNFEYDNAVVPGYEDSKIGKLNGVDSNTWIKQSAKWTNDSKTAAELRVDYSYTLDRPRDVVFVLDVSGSMYGKSFDTMIGTVQRMTYSILKQAKNCRVAYTAFSDGLKASMDFTNDIRNASAFLSSLYANGGTNYSSGLDRAASIVGNRADKSREPMLIFFTDGEPNLGNVSNGIYGGREARSIKSHDCPISCVYLNQEQQERYNAMTQLCSISTSPDMVYDANDISTLADAFKSAFYSAAHTNIVEVELDTQRFTTSATTATTITTVDGSVVDNATVTIANNKITWDVSKLTAATGYYITIPLQLVSNPQSGGPRGASGTYPTSLEGSSTIARVVDFARNNKVANTVETPILSALSLDETSYIRYYDGSTLLQQSVIYDGAITHTLTSAPITAPQSGAHVEDGIPVKDGYLFAGWYTTNLTVGQTNGTAFPTTITIADYDDADGNLNLYAAWVPVGTVSKDANDKNTYTGALKGFSLEGVQIRSKEVADKYQNPDRNFTEDALRFVTVYRNGMLDELKNLNNKPVTYGYTAYAKSDISSLTSLNKKTTGAVDVDCTQEGDHNHRMFTNYRLSTLVIKYDGADSSFKGELVEARAYVDYTDANGFARRGYNTYSDSKFAGGCRTSFNNAWTAVSQAYNALAKIA